MNLLRGVHDELYFLSIKKFFCYWSLLVLQNQSVLASELDKPPQRLIDQVQLSLNRARTVATQSDPNSRRR